MVKYQVKGDSTCYAYAIQILCRRQLKYEVRLIRDTTEKYYSYLFIFIVMGIYEYWFWGYLPSVLIN